MFKPVAMTRLSVVVLERDERTVLRQLGQAGVMQLTRAVAGPDTAPLAPRNRSADLARLERLSLRLGSLRQALELPAPAAETIEPATTSLDEAEKNLRRMEEQVSAPLKRRQQLLERTDELAAIGEQVSGYRELAIPLDRPDESSFLHFVTGTLPADNFGKLAVGDNVALVPMPERNGRQPLVADHPPEPGGLGAGAATSRLSTGNPPRRTRRDDGNHDGTKPPRTGIAHGRIATGECHAAKIRRRICAGVGPD